MILIFPGIYEYIKHLEVEDHSLEDYQYNTEVVRSPNISKTLFVMNMLEPPRGFGQEYREL